MNDTTISSDHLAPITTTHAKLAGGNMVLSVPLTDLVLGHELNPSINARIGDPNEGVPELAALIKANNCKLIQMPIAKPLPRNRGTMATQQYGVFAGNRRAGALRLLANEGAIAKDEMIDIVVRDVTDAEALEISLAENVHRLPPHPVDQFETFVRLIAEGMNVEEIGTRWCMKEKMVRQRLALGNLSPVLRKLLRDDKMNLGQAQAFTIEPDHAAQERIFKLLKGKFGGHFGEGQIKYELTKGGNQSAALLEFVGRDGYIAAGGTVKADLFAEAQYPDDISLLNKLADGRIESKRAELLENGWSFVADEMNNEPGISPHFITQIKVRPVYTPQQVGTLSELEKKMKPLNYHDERAIKLRTQVEDIKTAGTLAAYTEKHKSESGCWLSFNRHVGRLDIVYGVKDPRKEPKASKSARAGAGSSLSSAKPKDPNAISQNLEKQLAVQFTAAIAKVVEGDSQLALCALIAGFMAGGLSGDPVRVHHDGRGSFANRDDGAAKKDFKFYFAMAQKKKPAERLAILAKIAGGALYLDCADRPEYDDGATEALIRACDVKHAREAIASSIDWKMYFAGINKAQALEAIEVALGAGEKQRLANKSKLEVEAAAIAKVPATKWLPREFRTVHYDGPVEKAKKAGSKK